MGISARNMDKWCKSKMPGMVAPRKEYAQRGDMRNAPRLRSRGGHAQRLLCVLEHAAVRHHKRQACLPTHASQAPCVTAGPVPPPVLAWSSRRGSPPAQIDGGSERERGNAREGRAQGRAGGGGGAVAEYVQHEGRLAVATSGTRSGARKAAAAIRKSPSNLTAAARVRCERRRLARSSCGDTVRGLDCPALR